MRAVALIENSDTHHLDHLGVLCIELGIPLLTTDEELYSKAKIYYPKLDIQLTDILGLFPSHLAKDYSVIFSSNFWNKISFQEYFYPHSMRFVYVPHGHSDKGMNYHWLEQFAEQDIALVYGKRMLDALAEKQVVLEKPVITGNYRLAYYLKEKNFYDSLFSARFEKRKKTILYAPTWNDAESSFNLCKKMVLDQLPAHYQLIVKLHPSFIKKDPQIVQELQEMYKEVLFLSDFSPIYPLLDKVDIYLGDFSSIGYDFLYFDRPLFFLTDKASYLTQCGTRLKLDENIYEQIDKTIDIYSENRRSVYLDTFGPPSLSSTIQSQLEKVLK